MFVAPKRSHNPSPRAIRPPPTSSSQKEEDVPALEEAKEYFKISTRLFGNRHCPAYLDNTSIEGGDVIESTNHWLEVISLWLKGKGLFFPVSVKREHYEHLIGRLNDYLSTLERYQKAGTSINKSDDDPYSEVCRQQAQVTQKEIEDGIVKSKIHYSPLYYCGGVMTQGHVITTKFKLYRDKIEVLFLNVGEGAQLHPELHWSETARYLHFQSFPTHIAQEVLFGKRGEEVFTRLIRLQFESGNGKVQGYTAQDIYGAFWKLGSVQSSFDSKPALRAKKPQLDSNCADMAVTLLIKDILIDLGYDKKQIQRFFCNELLANLMCYFNDLSENDSLRDEWLLMRAALEGFSTHVLHLCGNSVKEKEVIFCKSILEKLFQETTLQLRTLRQPQDPFPLELEEGNYLTLATENVKFKKVNIASDLIEKTLSNATSEITIPPPVLPSPDRLLETLKQWNKTASDLHASGQERRARQFVYRMMMTLPVPDPLEEGYWDKIPPEEALPALQSLTEFVCQGLSNKDKEYPSKYKIVMVLHTGYAIADKLARKNEKTLLTGFASPFVATYWRVPPKGFLDQLEQLANIFAKEEARFEFLLLPLETLNSKWAAICHYFKTHLAHTQNTLFALTEEKVDICEGVEEIGRSLHLRPFSPTAKHLLYLKQFLPEHFDLERLNDHFTDLWLNEKEEIPFEYNLLYFFAYYSWAFLTSSVTLPPPTNTIKIAKREEKVGSITFPVNYALRHMYYGQTLPTLGIAEGRCYSFDLMKKQGREKNENECMCSEISEGLTYDSHLTKKHYREWSRIFSAPSLQISSTLHWINQNLADTEQIYYQHLIEIALFDSGLLPRKIKEDLHILIHLRKCVAKGIQFFNSSHPNIQGLLFFVRLGICIETFVEQADLKDYETFLLDGKEAQENPWRFYNLLLLLYQVDLPRKKDSLKEMIKAQFWVSLFAKKNKDCDEEDLKFSSYPEFRHWSWQEIEWTADRYQQHLQEAFHDPSWVENLGLELAGLFSLTTDEPNINIVYPQIHFGEYTFDIEKVTLQRGNTQQLVPVRLEDQHKLVWIEDDKLVSIDDSSKYERDGEQLSISKRFDIGEGPEWYQKACIEDKDRCQHLLNHVLFKKKTHDLWLKEGTSNEFLISEEDHPRYFTLENGVVCKVTRSGPLHLLDWRQCKELAHFFKALGSELEVCCFARPGSSRIEEMDFLDLKLSFKGKQERGKWRLQCMQLPQYFLAEESSLEELNHFRGAIILENTLSRAVLIPKRCLTKEDEDFTTKVYLRASLALDKAGYFFFHLDEQANLLISDDPFANLFLTLLFAMQRDYKKALCYLPRAAAFRNYMHDPELRNLINNFKSLKEHSPESLAFYLRFGLLLFENNLQLLQASFQKKKVKSENEEESDEDIYIWLGEVYEKYVRILSTKEESRVPGYIRLNREEEAFFISQIKSHLMKADEKKNERLNLGPFLGEALRWVMPNFFWRPIFQVREQLLKNQDHYSFKIPIREYPSCLPEYYLIPLLSSDRLDSGNWPQFTVLHEKHPDFVRMDREEIRKYFMLLYEEAKKKNIQAELNILYLLRSQEMLLSSIEHFYAALLLYVHTYPQSFKDLTFGKDPEENRSIFIKILERSSTLTSSVWKVTTSVSKIFSGVIIFPYQASVQLKLPKAPRLQPLAWQFSQKETQRFIEVRNSLFVYFLLNGLIAKKIPIANENRMGTFDASSPTEKKLALSLSKGHTRLLNQKYGKTIYSLGIKPDELFEDALHYLKDLQKKISKVKRSAEKCAGVCPDIEFRLGLRKQSRDLPEIQVEGLLSEAYSKTDPMILRRANPTLSPENIQKALSKTIEYHLLRIHLFQLKKALKALEDNDIQGFGEAIANYGNIDPSQEPEIILYQSRTGKILHEKQMELMEWHIKTEGKVSLFAAPAGGGKTTVFQPIAMQRVKRLGGTAVSISPKPLYLVDRDGLAASAKHAHSLDIAVLEVSLDVLLNAADYQHIYEELIRYSNEKGLKITPEAYYALDLKYQLLLEMGKDLESIKWVSLILDHLQTKVTAFIDECRVNLSPLTQAKIGIGLPIPVPVLDQKVFLAIYEKLVCADILLQDRRRVDIVVGLAHNLQATMEESDYPLVKKAVLKSLTQHPLFEIPKDFQQDIFAYWMGGDEPNWRGGEEQEKAIELVKIYFDVFFSAAMKLVGRMKHVRSIKASEEIHVPARKRQATGAYFEEVFVTLIASIHGTLQEGLDEPQIQQLLRLAQKEHLKEVGSSGRVSETEEKFQKWMGDQNIRLKDFFQPNTKQMRMLVGKLTKHYGAIFWYLEKQILKQATYCPEQLIITPMYLINAFLKCEVFSADPAPQEIYGLHDPKQVKLDRTFSAHVVHQLSDPKNEKILTFPLFHRPLELFEWLLTHSPDIYMTLGMLADGGMLRDFSTVEIVGDFFIFLEKNTLPIKYDGAILFEDSSGKETEGELQLWLRGWRAPKVLKGHDVIEAMAALGFRWDELNLLTLIDPSHTTGANIKQKPGSTALVLLAEDFSLGDGIQTVMRMRDFLSNQSVIWGILAALKAQIHSKMQSAVCPAILRKWMLKNEAERIDKEILLGAYQKIAYFAAKPARDELQGALHDPAKQVGIWRRYRKGFVKSMDPDLIKRFKQKSTLEKASDVLLAYAEACYSSFGYSTKWKDASSVRKFITPVIESVEERIPLISARASHDLMQQTHMHVAQQQQVEMDQIQTQLINLSPSLLEPLPDYISIKRPGFVLHLSEYSQQACDLFKSEGFTKGFYFTSNALHTAETGITPLGETYLKPVQYIIVVLEDKTWSAFALSDYEAACFQEQLLNYTDGKRKVALLSSSGALIQNGREAFAFSEEELNSRFVQDVTIDAGLSQCVLYHPERFIERLQTWEDFWPVWERIKSWQTLPEEIHASHIERLVPISFKVEKEKEPEKPKKGFFSWFS